MALFAGLLTTTSTQAQIISPPSRFSEVDENGVNITTGQATYSQTDMSIGPDGNEGLIFRTIYDGVFRNSLSNTMRVYQMNAYNGTTGGSTSFHVGDIAEGMFENGVFTSGTGWATTPQGFISGNGTTLDFSHLVSYAYYCLPCGQGLDTWHTEAYYAANYVEFVNGVRWTFHFKDETHLGQSESRVQSVTSNTGYQIKFYYGTNTVIDQASRMAWLTISKVVGINNAFEYCDPDADSCRLSTAWPQATYSDLSGYRYITNAVGAQTKIRMPSIYSFGVTTPGSSTENIQYDYTRMYDDCPGLTEGWWSGCQPGNPYKVTQARINGKTTNYSYSSGGATTTATGPLSHSMTYTRDGGSSRIATVTDSLSRTTSFTYDTPFYRLKSATYPEGNKASLVIDNDVPGNPYINGRGNPTQTVATGKPGSGASITENRTYPACVSSNLKICNQPTSYTDPRGNTTDYTYDAAHGGKLTETLPADVNGVRPVKRYAYAQRYAWIKNASGSYVQAPTPIWLLTEERTCRTSATVSGACAAGAGDEVVTTYDYGPNSGPNNLLLRGKVVTADGNALRTCYSYDIYGHKISETAPRAGLTSCS